MGKDDYLAITEPQRKEEPHCLSDRKRDYRRVVLLMIMGKRKSCGSSQITHKMAKTSRPAQQQTEQKIMYRTWTWAQWGTKTIPPGQRTLGAHWPRTKVYHLLMTLAACAASCCRQVISFHHESQDELPLLPSGCDLTCESCTHSVEWEKRLIHLISCLQIFLATVKLYSE